MKRAFLIFLAACGTCLTAACTRLPIADQAESGATPAMPQTRAAETPGKPKADAGREPVDGIAFPIVTRHQGRFNGQSVSYTASVGELEVQDDKGNAGARIVSTSYVVDALPGAPPRPVMFVFNGGPISPSVYLHMGAFGPRRVAFADDLNADPASAPLVDNPYCILDVTDLVYFDPAGTGFSRTVPGKALEDYFSIEADGQQTAAFIAQWLKANQRSDSPAYIFGESYGTNRAVETAGQLAKLPEPVLLDGVVLFGEAVNIIEYAQRPNNIISYVVSLPTLAALGWYHNKADSADTDFETFVESAWQYAQTVYLGALFQGNTLPPDRLNEIAQRLEQFTGLRSEYFVEKRLRVSKEAYRVELFKNEGLILGRSDGRYVGPTKAEGVESTGDGPPDPAVALPEALAKAFRDYLVSDLGVASAEQYVTASPVQGLSDWGWSGSTPFSPFAYGDALSVLLEKNPRSRVLVAAGYFDTMTTIGASRYLVNQEAWPAERVTLKYYRGGHMAYSIEDSARQMAGDLRKFILAGQLSP